MKKRKTIIAALILLLLLIIGGAVAYFTDTDTRSNEFTLGKVDIRLVEEKFDDVVANLKNQDIVPGVPIAKDPVVENIGKNSAFVFLEVTTDCISDTKPVALFKYDAGAEWTLLSGPTACGENGTTSVYYYGVDELKPLEKNTSTEPLFTTVTLNEELTTKDVTLNELDSEASLIKVNAYAIQAEGLEDSTPTGVWANFQTGSQTGGNNQG